MNNKKICLVGFLTISLCLLFDSSLVSVAQEKNYKEPPVEEAVPIGQDQAYRPQENEMMTPVVVPAAAVQPEEPKEPDVPAARVEPGNVTVNFKGADIKTVLAYISEVSGVDIVPAPDVKGTIDLKLTNKPWKTALDIILRNYGFAYEREGDIIRVVTVDKLKAEELTTQAFNLNYSKSKDVATSIKDIVSERGKVTYDERTNTVLVTDIPTNIYKIGQVVERLDKQTDQILIEARIIETALDDSEKLGIDWNVKLSVSGAKRPTTFPFDYFKMPFNSAQDSMIFFPQVLSSSPSTTTTTSGGGVASETASEFPANGGKSGSFGFPYAGTDQFTFGTLDFSQFSAVLEMIKSRSNTDLISNPRITTLNNNEAFINVGNTLNMPKYERSSTTGKMEITGYEPKDLGIMLKVVPHVNDKDEIVIDLTPQISDLLRYDTLDKSSGVVAPVFSVRQAKTQVMVKDGDTIFIGGLIKENIIDTRKKLPFLGDIFGDVPYLGLLVTKKEITKQKTELIFFITVNLMNKGRVIKDLPDVNKAYVPMYTITQQKDVTAKKRPNKKFW
ncbi:MAG: secretin N-terminal domain-containing protein [Candidatus Omnitrophota bacterium]|nr:secretin N-terminal domain-containing protein [Candidatus Omnitrophota bacterium]